ncbi:MAG: ribonuclease P protein component [Burkholderiaceae bacterium]
MPIKPVSPRQTGSDSLAGTQAPPGKTAGMRVGQSRAPRMPRAAGRYFAVAPVRRKPVVSPPGTDPRSGNINPGSQTLAHNQAKLLLAVPKRLLRRAVDRNAVRRAAREAWRKRVGTHSGRIDDALLRMTALPAGIGQISRPKRKTIWRQELEELMDQYLGKPDAQ